MSGWNDGGRGDDTVKKAKEPGGVGGGVDQWRHEDIQASRYYTHITHTQYITLTHSNGGTRQVTCGYHGLSRHIKIPRGGGRKTDRNITIVFNFFCKNIILKI